MGKQVSFTKAIDIGIISLSKAQIAKAKKNGVKKVWYSNQAKDPDPQLLNDVGETVFYLVNGKMRKF